MKTKEKTRRKPGVLDAVIVILIILAAVLALYFLFGKGALSTGSKTQKITFAVEFRKMDEAFLESIEVGSSAYDNEKGYYLGTVVGYESNAHVAITPVPDLEKWVSYTPQVEGFLDIRLIIEGDAVVTNASTTINDSLIAVGEPKFIRTSGLSGKVYIVSIDFEGGALSD